MYCIGIDIGSISVKVALVASSGEVEQTRYCRSHGQPIATLRRMLQDLLIHVPNTQITGVAATGSGGKLVAELFNCHYTNEAVAQSTATRTFHPDIRTIIEIGGEDAKLILLGPASRNSRLHLQDVAMNMVCAAGTGSFLDQQAQRLGISIEDEFGRLACQSQHPPQIAGRCSVFAKSDMIHLQQAAVPAHDIVMGLCLALARTFKSSVIKNHTLQRPIAFQGGVAANAGMIRALHDVLELSHGELIIPRFFACMGAIGAARDMLEHGSITPFPGLEPLDCYLASGSRPVQRHERLPVRSQIFHIAAGPITGHIPCDAYLGVDVGSISTNLAVVDASGRVIARRYLMTAGRPIEAVQQGLREIGAEIGTAVTIKAAATTGSGRYLIGDVIGADIVINEITAHARGAAHMDPRVDTIFEIGGQDSKYIRIDNGAVVDFTMNKVCAAGTGSFLEEQAEKLGLNIKDEFSRLALSSPAPAALGERCTVFMESSLNRLLQQGVAKEDLVAGLCYAIVLNYLGKVVEDRPVGEVIFFQGGTAYNAGVVAAFEKVCGKKIIVPPHHDVLGAIGCALIARDRCPTGTSKFRGFDLGSRPYTVESFECTDCPNACVIRRVSVTGEQPLHYGSRCGKFDEGHRQSRSTALPHLFAEREQVLLTTGLEETTLPANAPVIGIPRATIFHEFFPFWQAFFAELGFRLVPSAPTNRHIISKGCALSLEEPCFPIKAAHGHIFELLEQGVDYLFLPSIINAEPVVPDAVAAYVCLYVQSLPFTFRAAIDTTQYRTRILSPVLHLGWGEKTFLPELRNLARELGSSEKKVRQAYHAALRAQTRFRNKLLQRGSEALAAAPEGTPIVVIVSRPYNGCDPGLTFKIPEMLRDLGALAVPVDMLAGAFPASDSDLRHMYWRSGQKILAAAPVIARNPRLQAVYITNFGCGPDSFIIKHFKRALQGKPFLTLELDEHTADAGVLTRLEAFMESLPRAAAASTVKPALQHRRVSSCTPNGRILYIPYMDDHGKVLAAVMRFFGVIAEALPMADEESIAAARPFTSGKECYPCILTTGDIIKKTRAPDFDPERAAFLMATAAGPCRFGQYSRFHRMVLDELGLCNVPLLALDQTVHYTSDLRKLGTRFRRLGWQAVLAVDYFKKLLLHTRPYEKNAGDCDQVYAACLERLAQHLEHYGSIGDCCSAARDRFAAVAVNRSIQRPLVGIIGEIYVRSNAFSNNFIIRRLEALGAEVVIPPLQEWVMYTDWERRRDLQRLGQRFKLFTEWISQRVQQSDVASVRKCFASSGAPFLEELPTEEILRLSAPYLSEHVRGEANLSLGRAVEYLRHHCHGIVNLIPFGCMPGTIVNALLCLFSREYPQVPLLKMAYDGTPQSGDELRIETFVYQVYAAWRAAQN